jgi:hypothetical protein
MREEAAGNEPRADPDKMEVEVSDSCFQVDRDSETGEKQAIGARPNIRYFGARASSWFMGSKRLIQTC